MPEGPQRWQKVGGVIRWARGRASMSAVRHRLMVSTGPALSFASGAGAAGSPAAGPQQDVGVADIAHAAGALGVFS